MDIETLLLQNNAMLKVLLKNQALMMVILEEAIDELNGDTDIVDEDLINRRDALRKKIAELKYRQTALLVKMHISGSDDQVDDGLNMVLDI